MFAVSLRKKQVTLVELPRPQLEQPHDAIVMVTTTAIGHWEIEQAGGPVTVRAPGAQFTGIVVETGGQVAEVNIDDLVVAKCAVKLADGEHARFGDGSTPLPDAIASGEEPFMIVGAIAGG